MSTKTIRFILELHCSKLDQKLPPWPSSCESVFFHEWQFDGKLVIWDFTEVKEVLSSQYACIWLFLEMWRLWEILKSPKCLQASLGAMVSEKQLYTLIQVETIPLWSCSNMLSSEIIVWFCLDTGSNSLLQKHNQVTLYEKLSMWDISTLI